MKNPWEIIYSEALPNHSVKDTARMEVPGGWLVRTDVFITREMENSVYDANMAFVADPGHDWQIK